INTSNFSRLEAFMDSEIPIGNAGPVKDVSPEVAESTRTPCHTGCPTDATEIWISSGCGSVQYCAVEPGIRPSDHIGYRRGIDEPSLSDGKVRPVATTVAQAAIARIGNIEWQPGL